MTWSFSHLYVAVQGTVFDLSLRAGLERGEKEGDVAGTILVYRFMEPPLDTQAHEKKLYFD